MRAILLCTLVLYVVLASTVASASSMGSYNPFHAIQVKEQMRDAAAAVDTLNDHARTLHTSIKHTFAAGSKHNFQSHALHPITRGVMQVEAVSASCNASVTAMIAIADRCSAQFNAAYTSYSSQSAIAAFCESDCYKNMNAALVEFEVQCKAEIAEDVDMFASARDKLIKAQTILKTVCIKEPATQPGTGNGSSNGNATYCFPEFINAFNEAGMKDSYNKGTFTVAALARICTPCTEAIFASLASSGDANGSRYNIRLLGAYRLLCAADTSSVTVSNPNGYCYPVLASLSASASGTINLGGGSGSGNALVSTNMLEALCSPCGKKMIQIAIAIDSNAGTNSTSAMVSFQTALNLMCIRNDNGELCMASILALSTSFDDVVCQAPLDNNCPTDLCRRHVQTIFDRLGCCMGSILQVLKEQAAANGDDSGEAFASMQAQLDKCGISINLTPCRVRRSVTARLIFRNLRWAWIVANRARFVKSLRQDLAAMVGQPEDNIFVGELSATAGTSITVNGASGSGLKRLRIMASESSGVSVPVDVAVASDNEAAAVAQSMSSSQSGSNDAQVAQYPATNSCGASCKNDPSAPATAASEVDAQPIEGGVGTDSSAFAAASSSMIVAIVAIVFAALMQ